MEKIEKVVERTVKDVHISYKAIDGTIFTNADECRRYEETSEAVLLARLHEIQINVIPCGDLFEDSGEGIYRVVIPTAMKHINTLNQLWKLNGGATSDELLFDKEDLNTIVLVGVRLYEGKIEWAWFWKFNKVIEKVTDNKFKIVPIEKDNG